MNCYLREALLWSALIAGVALTVRGCTDSPADIARSEAEYAVVKAEAKARYEAEVRACATDVSKLGLPEEHGIGCAYRAIERYKLDISR